MKVLMISKDTSLFSEESEAFKELLATSEQVEAIHAIVFTSRRDNFQFKKVSDKLFLYPTNSSSNFFAIFDAQKIVKKEFLHEGFLTIDVIIADDPLSTVAAAYRIGKKYNRNFIINVGIAGISFDFESGFIIDAIKRRIFDFLYSKAAGFRVPGELDGETLVARNPDFEKRIYVLPFITPDEKQEETKVKMDIHTKFPAFNIILIFVNPYLRLQDLKDAEIAMETLRSRYPRVGLVVVGNVSSSVSRTRTFRKLPEYIVVEKKSEDLPSYYDTANALIDVSEGVQTGESLLRASHAGCPIVSYINETSSNIVHPGENGFLVEPHNPKLLARKLIDILEEKGLRAKMHMYRYNVTDIYGNDKEEYRERVIYIWEKFATHEPTQALAPKLVEVKTEPKLEVVAEPIPEPVKEPLPEVVPEPIPEPTPEPLLQIEPDPLSEPQPEPESEPVAEVWPELTPEPSPEPEPEILPEPAPEPESELQPVFYQEIPYVPEEKPLPESKPIHEPIKIGIPEELLERGRVKIAEQQNNEDKKKEKPKFIEPKPVVPELMNTPAFVMQRTPLDKRGNPKIPRQPGEKPKVVAFTLDFIKKVGKKIEEKRPHRKIIKTYEIHAPGTTPPNLEVNEDFEQVFDVDSVNKSDDMKNLIAEAVKEVGTMPEELEITVS